ncbi:MAG: Gfo/Idh/MocA family oxidoreductase [Bacteroidales bacterium]|nr:Gfo/Idh/MocA family oxidoreductase [Bacteroidales bacterium]
MSEKNGKGKNGISRRDILKGIATLPVLAYFGFRFHSQYESDILPFIEKGQTELPNFGYIKIPSVGYRASGDKIRLGIVGNGMRGAEVFRALGYATEGWLESNLQNGDINQNVKNFFGQENLNVEITGVCDTFSVRMEEAANIASSEVRSGGAKPQKRPILYSNYREMLSDNNLDAIVILTPDHWHAKMAIDAAKEGKHIYLEKPMCQTADEAKLLKGVIGQSGVVLQVGHQNRQQASYIMAKNVVESGLLGDISMIETYTFRNSSHGAWNRIIPEPASRDNINWREFLGDKRWHEFDLDRYFNWQKWFEYGTGPAGNQFTHEYDCVNQILNLGIPKRVSAVGGNFFYKDSRDIPDVLNCTFVYPDRGLTLTYNCTLKSSVQRDITFLGSEGAMQVNVALSVFADRESDKYKGKVPDFERPMYVYNPKKGQVDASTSATMKYYQERGFGYTYHNGHRIDATYLHMKEWLHCIRNKQQPSCNVDRGFEETITFYMANLAYLENRIVEWDEENQEII